MLQVPLFFAMEFTCFRLLQQKDVCSSTGMRGSLKMLAIIAVCVLSSSWARIVCGGHRLTRKLTIGYTLRSNRARRLLTSFPKSPFLQFAQKARHEFCWQAFQQSRTPPTIRDEVAKHWKYGYSPKRLIKAVQVFRPPREHAKFATRFNLKAPFGRHVLFKELHATCNLKLRFPNAAKCCLSK